MRLKFSIPYRIDEKKYFAFRNSFLARAREDGNCSFFYGLLLPDAI